MSLYIKHIRPVTSYESTASVDSATFFVKNTKQEDFKSRENRS